MTEKVRAERNRTLTISTSEIPTLEKFIFSANDIKQSFADDSIINADLFDCLRLELIQKHIVFAYLVRVIRPVARLVEANHEPVGMPNTTASETPHASMASRAPKRSGIRVAGAHPYRNTREPEHPLICSFTFFTAGLLRYGKIYLIISAVKGMLQRWQHTGYQKTNLKTTASIIKR